MAGCCCAEACTAAVLIGALRLPGCPFDSAWCLVCEVCRLTVDWVDCRYFLSFVFLGGARRLELSTCNTHPRKRHNYPTHTQCAWHYAEKLGASTMALTIRVIHCSIQTGVRGDKTVCMSSWQVLHTGLKHYVNV